MLLFKLRLALHVILLLTFLLILQLILLFILLLTLLITIILLLAMISITIINYHCLLRFLLISLSKLRFLNITMNIPVNIMIHITTNYY